MPVFASRHLSEFVTERCKNVNFADQVFFTVRDSINNKKDANFIPHSVMSFYVLYGFVFTYRIGCGPVYEFLTYLSVPRT